MCGRYVLPGEVEIGQFWHVVRHGLAAPAGPRYNVAPTLPVPVLFPGPDSRLELASARWGLIPAWWRKDTPPATAFNARAEEAERKPLWRDSLRTSRCLMPARGWYEWNASEPARDGSGRKCPQPYFLFCPGAPLFAFAAVRATWVRPGSPPVVSCALLTTRAAPAVSRIHPRMPVVLKPELEAPWLDPTTPLPLLERILADARNDLAAYPVSSRVNHVRQDAPDLLDPVRISMTDTLAGF